MMVGGAIVNALAFWVGNYFSTLRESNAKEIEAERKRHNKALDQLKQLSHNGPDAEWRD